MYHIIQTQMCIELKVFIESIFVEEYNLGFNLQLNLIWLISPLGYIMYYYFGMQLLKGCTFLKKIIPEIFLKHTIKFTDFLRLI